MVGAVKADIPMGIAVYQLWVFVLRSQLLDFALRWLRERFEPGQPVSGRPVNGRWGGFVAITAMLVSALAVGIA